MWQYPGVLQWAWVTYADLKIPFLKHQFGGTPRFNKGVLHRRYALGAMQV
jgi:hypothetical protein